MSPGLNIHQRIVRYFSRKENFPLLIGIHVLQTIILCMLSGILTSILQNSFIIRDGCLVPEQSVPPPNIPDPEPPVQVVGEQWFNSTDLLLLLMGLCFLPSLILVIKFLIGRLKKGYKEVNGSFNRTALLKKGEDGKWAYCL